MSKNEVFPWVKVMSRQGRYCGATMGIGKAPCKCRLIINRLSITNRKAILLTLKRRWIFSLSGCATLGTIRRWIEPHHEIKTGLSRCPACRWRRAPGKTEKSIYSSLVSPLYWRPPVYGVNGAELSGLSIADNKFSPGRVKIGMRRKAEGGSGF